jgi:hypothetical protein
MNAQDFLDFAGKTAHLHREPAGCRSTISRAYYGAFHLASEFMLELGISIDANHGHLQHDFRAGQHPDAIDIGAWLQELHSLRVKADYRLREPSVEMVAMGVQCVETAQELKRRLDSLRGTLQSGEDRRTFVEAIAAYRRKVNRRT